MQPHSDPFRNSQWDWRYNGKIAGVTHGGWSHTSREWGVQIEPAFNAAGQRRMTAREFDLQNRIVRPEEGQWSADDGGMDWGEL